MANKQKSRVASSHEDQLFNGNLPINYDIENLSVCSEESSDSSFFNLSEDHFSEVASAGVQLDNNGLPTQKKQIVHAITKYMRLIRLRGNDEALNAQLIVRLCELRIKLNKMNEEAEERLFHSHRLNKPSGGDNPSNNSMICDICLKKQKLSLIPAGLLKNFNFLLTCDYCEFNVHRNCMTDNCKPRLCPRDMFESDPDADYSSCVMLDICPERGLSRQEFRCADCKQGITAPAAARLCDYDGLYYCSNCHWGDQEQIPARVLHNWDFEPRPVSRKSLQLISYVKKRPVLFNVLEFNTMLYGLVDELNLLKRLRQELVQMVQYIKLCSKTKPNFDIDSYLYEENKCDSYAFGDLVNTGGLQKSLNDIHEQLTRHITSECESCRGKGFFCEMCNDKSDLLFPFSANIANCPSCGTVFHKTCFHRKHKNCPKCFRLRQKKILLELQGQSTPGVSDIAVSQSENNEI